MKVIFVCAATLFGVADEGGAVPVVTKKVGRPFWQELPFLVVIAAVIAAVIVHLIGRPYVIPSESMETTLHGCAGCTRDRIFVEKLSYYFRDTRPGDVVVFVGPTDSWNKNHASRRSSNPVVRPVEDFFSFFGLVPPDENDLVKRVVAVGGQTVECCDPQGRIIVDGKALDEPYARYDIPYQPGLAYKASYGAGREFGPVRVPEGYLWVMGDNRNHSADSRAHTSDEFGGTVPVSDVRGRAVFKIWPPSRLGPVESPR